MEGVHTKERQLEQELAGRIEQRVPGTEVLAVELLGPERFCVYIDHPKGVDHALCERVTRELDDYRRNYTVDVSSPGIDRPLRKPAHFGRFVGRTVKLRTAARGFAERSSPRTSRQCAWAPKAATQSSSRTNRSCGAT